MIVRFGGFGQAMCRDLVEERRDMIRAIAKGRKLSDLPKISQVHFYFAFFFVVYLPHFHWTVMLNGFIFLLLQQPTLIVWGEHDRVFPLELAHRLKRLVRLLPYFIL